MQETVVRRAEAGGDLFASTIRDLAEALGVSPEELIGEAAP
jgi:hypothetical protein